MTEDPENKSLKLRILGTISEIKRRKYGVTAARICKLIQRSFGRPSEEVLKCLEILVKDKVLQVKGRSGLKSYKVIKELIDQKPRSGMESKQQNLSKAILEVIREEKYGVSAAQIHQTVNKAEGLTDLSLEEVHAAIRIENELGTIRERLSGLYCISCRQAKRRKFDGYYLSDDDETIEEAKTNSKKKKKQIKKAKLCPPSNPPSVPNEQPMVNEDVVKVENDKAEACAYCGLDSTDELKHLVCQSCLSRIHQKCLDYNDKLADRCRQYPWQCMNCKTCTICKDPGNPDNMLFCDACDKGYHTSCHDPKITDTPQGAWVCSSCEKEDKQIDELQSNNNSESNLATAPEVNNFTLEESQSPSTYDHLDSNNNSNNDNGSDDLLYEVSNIATWNAQEITNFFKSLGFIKEADVFEYQEIDGKTLLLMKRQDILTELSLKLGPALKIYKHVNHLQMGWSSQKCIADAAKQPSIIKD